MLVVHKNRHSKLVERLFYFFLEFHYSTFKDHTRHGLVLLRSCSSEHEELLCLTVAFLLAWRFDSKSIQDIADDEDPTPVRMSVADRREEKDQLDNGVRCSE